MIPSAFYSAALADLSRSNCQLKQSTAVNDGSDRDRVSRDLINNSIAVSKDLADIFIVEFRNDAADEWET